MHRSGTSALTRVLGLAGAMLPRNPMGGSEFNARGFFESVPVYQLHEEMLEAFGTSWDDLSPMPSGWMSSGLAAQYADRMAEVVREEYDQSPLFVVKDPRLCRLVPFWLRVLDQLEVDPSFVIPVRNPLEVSASLKRAHEIGEQRGRLLWLQHFLLAERDTRGHSRCLLTYDQLLEDWRRVVERIGQELDLSLPRMSRRAGAEIDDFLTEALRHHEYPTEGVEVRADVGDWIKKAYRWAERAAQGKPPAFRTLDAVTDAFLAAEEVFGPVVATSEHRRREEARTVATLREELEQRAAQPSPREVAKQSAGVEARMDEANQSAGVEARMDELVDGVKMLLVWVASTQSRGQAGGEQLERLLKELDERGGEGLPGMELVKLAAHRESVEQDAQTTERIRELGVQLAESSAELSRLAPFEEMLTEMRGRVSQLDSAVVERDAEVRMWAERLGDREREIEQLRTTVDELQRVREKLAVTEAERDGEERSWVERLGDREREIEQLRTTADEVNRMREQLAATEAERDVGVRTWAERLGDRDREIEQLRTTVDEVNRVREKLAATEADRDAWARSAAEYDRELLELRRLVPEVEALRESASAASEERAILIAGATEREAELSRLMSELREKTEIDEAEIVRLREEVQALTGVEVQLTQRDAEIGLLRKETERMTAFEVQ
ncbi:MAG: hypothetical protein JRJ58_24435, partial [Deltaproteobacteria bacterium]|nr:hypothetical protein [Deltaproteobacteria bacterium]